jgi:chemosensory pili system protein ChpA (sensor histidine kinase/response regulator)
MTDLLQSAADMLRGLVQQIKDGTPVQGSVAYLMSCADALSKGEPPPASVSGKQQATDEQAPAVDLLIEPELALDTSTLPIEEKGADEDVPGQEDEEPDAGIEEVVCNGVMDPMLYEIFTTESRGHLDDIRKFLSQAAAGDSTVDDTLARALHTLHGSAHMAEAEAIADLAGMLERWIKALMGAGQPLADEGCDVLTESVGMVDQMLFSLPSAISRPERYAELLQHIDSLREAVSIPNAEAMPVDVIAQDTAADAPEENALQTESESLDETGDESEDPYASCDEELMEVFIEETVANLETSNAALSRWRESSEDSEALVELQRALHTVKGGARMAEINPIGDLAHAAEALIMAITDGLAGADVCALDGVQHAQDSLAAMLEKVRNREPAASADALIKQLQELSERRPEPDNTDDAVDEMVEDTGAEQQAPAVEVEAAQATDDPYAETDQELLEVFLEEAGDIMENSEQTLQNWKHAPDEQSLIVDLQRELHTLKGGARMADITEIGDLAHAVESLMVKAADGEITAGESMFTVLQQAHDRLSGMVDQVRNRQPLEQAATILQDLELLAEGKDVVKRTANPEETAAGKSGESEERRAHSRNTHELVRVKATLLDNMVNYAGEVSIYRSRLEQQVGAYRFNLVELDQTVSRVSEQLRKLDIETEAQVLFRYEEEIAEGPDNEEFDPLEMDRYSHMQQLSRSLAESVSDLGSIQGMLENITRESETLLLQQSRVNTELQEGLMRTRMVPFLRIDAHTHGSIPESCCPYAAHSTPDCPRTRQESRTGIIRCGR